MNNMISICITYYNQENYVKNSLESVINLNFPCDYEILCGDDGSCDNTLNIIKNYAEKYPEKIKYFKNKRLENEKSINRASLNRLNLASHAKGDYIIFLDGDDYYCDKEFVKNAINILANNKEIEGYAFNFKYLNTDNTENIFNQKMKQGIIRKEEYISKSYYTPAGAIIFRNILDKQKLEFLKKINNFDDNALTVYMLQFGDIYYEDRVVYTYRQSNDSLWNNVTKIEQALINAFDYKLMLKSAPSLKNNIKKRQYGSIKYLYKNKKNLKKLLGNKYEKYLNIAINNQDNFIKNMLIWNKLGIKNKLKIIISWNLNKI